jgi:surface protein
MLSIISKLNVKLLSSLAISSLLLFSACSGGGRAQGGNGAQNSVQDFTLDSVQSDFQKGENSSIEGKFMDSGVEGIAYVTDSTSGYTDSDGKFLYNPNDKHISFSVGSIIIKKDFNLSKLNADGIIFPSDILGTKKRGNTTNKNLVNLLRVLHSIDNDNNASNGIFINDDIKGYLYEDMDIATVSTLELKNMMEYAGKTLVNSSKVRRHYIQTLIKNNIEPELMPFITVWKTDSSENSITIPVNTKYDYNYTVDWGDGNIDKNITNSKKHNYQTTGDHTVKISGDFPYFKGEDKQQLQLVTQWGDIAWKDFNMSFDYCLNLDVNATDNPDLRHVTNLEYMFSGSKNLKGNIYFNDWDVSNITSLFNMFGGTSYFNQPLNNWNVSNVKDISAMFERASAFNQPLNNWDVGKVTDMSFMFYSAIAFNQSLNNWNVSNVTTMYAMFYNSKAFNHPLNNWNVSSVTNMTIMFYGAEIFNEPLNNWNISSVVEIEGMFMHARSFNQPLNNWDVSNVTTMKGLFDNAKAFNQELSGWDVSSVTTMYNMFYNATAFNQPLIGWNVSNVIDMASMFNSASAFKNQNLSGWNVEKVKMHSNFIRNSGGQNTEPNWK